MTNDKYKDECKFQYKQISRQKRHTKTRHIKLHVLHSHPLVSPETWQRGIERTHKIMVLVWSWSLVSWSHLSSFLGSLVLICGLALFVLNLVLSSNLRHPATYSLPKCWPWKCIFRSATTKLQKLNNGIREIQQQKFNNIPSTVSITVWWAFRF